MKLVLYLLMSSLIYVGCQPHAEQPTVRLFYYNGFSDIITGLNSLSGTTQNDTTLFLTLKLGDSQSTVDSKIKSLVSDNVLCDTVINGKHAVGYLVKIDSRVRLGIVETHTGGKKESLMSININFYNVTIAELEKELEYKYLFGGKRIGADIPISSIWPTDYKVIYVTDAYQVCYHSKEMFLNFISDVSAANSHKDSLLSRSSGNKL